MRCAAWRPRLVGVFPAGLAKASTVNVREFERGPACVCSTALSSGPCKGLWKSRGQETPGIEAVAATRKSRGKRPPGSKRGPRLGIPGARDPRDRNGGRDSAGPPQPRHRHRPAPRRARFRSASPGPPPSAGVPQEVEREPPRAHPADEKRLGKACSDAGSDLVASGSLAGAMRHPPPAGRELGGGRGGSQARIVIVRRRAGGKVGRSVGCGGAGRARPGQNEGV